MSTKKLKLNYIHQNHIYVIESGKQLIMDGREINEFIIEIIDTGTMYRIIGADRQGDLMMISYDDVIKT